MDHRIRTVCGLVIKRQNIGEQDRLVTLLTQEEGKVTAKAKGVRRHAAPRQSFLELGTVVHASLTKGAYPIITQVKLESSPELSTLKQHRQFFLLLELYDALLVNEELPEDLFAELLDIRTSLLCQAISRSELQQRLRQVIESLGFRASSQESVSNITSQLTGRSLNSFEFLTP